MVRKLAYFFLFASLHGMAQEKIATTGEPIVVSKTLTAYAGEVYLDSVKIDIAKTFLDPDNIKNIGSFKGAQAQVHSGTTGVTLITRKKYTELESLRDLISRARSGTLKDVPKVNVVINGNLISDLEKYMIETSAIKEISILINSEKNTDYSQRMPTIIITTKQMTKLP